MKKLLLGAAALLALGATANAADLPARTYTKAPAPIVVQNWTGFYIGGGFGYGVSNIDGTPATNPANVATNNTVRYGGRGWLGTVSGGYDYQFSPSWVAGIFGDAQFSDISGNISNGFGLTGSEKLRQSYAAGARLGYLVAPNVLSYVNGGYTHASFNATSYAAFNVAPTTTTSKWGRDGWFLGSGVENNLDIFGFKAPGWTVKTEYRYAYYGTRTLTENLIAAPATIVQNQNFKAQEQTITTQLVYKFNWR